MLDNLRNIISNLQQFDWGAELENIVETNKDALAELQAEQWYEGKDSEGQPITLDGRGYSKKTFEIKTAKGQPTDRVTLTDTGALAASLQADVNNQTFTLKGNTSYEAELIERTGEQVYGLDEEKRLQFGVNVTLPSIKMIFKDKTGFVISE
jgi:hypothetical protein